MRQRDLAGLAGRAGEADAAEEAFCVKPKLRPGRLLFRGNIRNPVIKAGDGDAAGLVLELAQNIDQDLDGVERQPAEKAGMQVAPGAVNAQLDGGQAA